ncbi:hypothetical protein E2C01_001507 [Portunus trituberculatus]|uniref:Uncharacterized protein n=1 Tax=Portunus trituberculatus TaxID=210409 RepID=A0A5B7CHT9_PORTR|nr:hypothetical protein [Portunus trituberculatus]
MNWQPQRVCPLVGRITYCEKLMTSLRYNPPVDMLYLAIFSGGVGLSSIRALSHLKADTWSPPWHQDGFFLLINDALTNIPVAGRT